MVDFFPNVHKRTMMDFNFKKVEFNYILYDI